MIHDSWLTPICSYRSCRSLHGMICSYQSLPGRIGSYRSLQCKCKLAKSKTLESALRTTASRYIYLIFQIAHYLIGTQTGQGRNIKAAISQYQNLESIILPTPVSGSKSPECRSLSPPSSPIFPFSSLIRYRLSSEGGLFVVRVSYFGGQKRGDRLKGGAGYGPRTGLDR